MDSPAEIPVLKPGLSQVIETSAVDNLMRSVYEQHQKSIVHIAVTSKDGSTFGGSGVVVKEGNDVVIVTNAHLAANPRSITFTNTAGETFPAMLEKFDDTDDLAVLKPDGVKINPAMAVDFGDASKLTKGQPLYAMGHVHEYARPVISGGTFNLTNTYANVDPATGNLVRGLADRLYHGNLSYNRDAAALANSPRIDAALASDHGNSGGALFDKSGKLVGITESVLDKNHKNEALSIPADKVQAMLADPNYKFQFKYDRETLAAASPAITTAKGAGLAALAASPLSQKFAAPGVGLYYGVQALQDLRTLSQDNLYESRAHYWEKFAADGGAFAAGMLSIVPRFRLVGAALVAGRLAVDLISDFKESKPLYQGFARPDGSKNEPLFWSIVHH